MLQPIHVSTDEESVYFLIDSGKHYEFLDIDEAQELIELIRKAVQKAADYLETHN